MKAELTKKLRQRGILNSGTYKKYRNLHAKQHSNRRRDIKRLCQDGEGSKRVCCKVFGSMDRLIHYSIEGKTDAMGVKQVNPSLKLLMSNCRDFIEEKSLLQSNGWKMGLIIDQMLKYHCELAGKGVEYSLACAKNEYQKN